MLNQVQIWYSGADIIFHKVYETYLNKYLHGSAGIQIVSEYKIYEEFRKQITRDWCPYNDTNNQKSISKATSIVVRQRALVQSMAICCKQEYASILEDKWKLAMAEWQKQCEQFLEDTKQFIGWSPQSDAMSTRSIDDLYAKFAKLEERVNACCKCVEFMQDELNKITSRLNGGVILKMHI
jgi:hypothetical protein